MLLAVAIAATTGCKEDTIIKAGVTPASDLLYTDNLIGDTLTINTKTVLDDSINTSYTSTSLSTIHGLGTLNDPFFGRTNWGIYMQVVPAAANLTLPSQVDSAVLILPYAGFTWGDTSGAATEKFTVYRVSQNMSDTATYYSKTFTPVESTPVSASVSVQLDKLSDSVKVQGANKAPHLRIKLTDAFRDILVTAAKSSVDNDAFLNQVKGLYICATDTLNGTVRRVPYFFITGSADYLRASVALYYQENGNTSPDSVRSSFLNFVYGDCAHYNYITRNYSGKTANQYFQSTLQSDSLMLLQNEPGAALDIRIPNLKNLPVGLINKAQLVITQVKQPGDESDKFFAPSRIYPVGVDSTGAAYTILDRLPLTSTSPLDFIDGTSHDVTMPDGTTVKQYYINIPREVQNAIVKKSKELHLRINGTVTYPGAYRLIAGGKHSNKLYKVRLNIVYTKIN